MKCPHCQTTCNGSKARARSTCVWSDPNGNCYRITCLVCGQVSEITTRYNAHETTTQIVQLPRDTSDAATREIIDRTRIQALEAVLIRARRELSVAGYKETVARIDDLMNGRKES